jgi:amidase
MEAQLTQIGLPLMSLPGLAVNTGMLGNTPIGIQLVAGRYHENALLLAGAAIELAGVAPSPVDPVR